MTNPDEARNAYNALVATLLTNHRGDIDFWGPMVNTLGATLGFPQICLDCGKSVRVVRQHGAPSAVHVDWQSTASNHPVRLDSAG